MPTSLVQDYLAFDRRRAHRRHYMKAFGGMALLVLIGAAFQRVPRGEAVIVAGLLVTPVLWLAIVELFHWRRLVRRLNDARTMRRSQSHKKAVRNGGDDVARAALHR